MTINPLTQYRASLFEQTLRISNFSQPPNERLRETIQLAEDAADFLRLSIEAAIAADVLLPLPQPIPQSSPSIADLQQQCCDLAKRLSAEDLDLTQQVEVALELVARIARLVRLESELAEQLVEAYVHPFPSNLYKSQSVDRKHH